MKEFITKNSEETKNLGRDTANNLKDKKVICLEGDLGSGKTTFSQGFLEESGAEGPFTSPTFLIMKEYILKRGKIYHIDAYRINEKDLLDFGWEEMLKIPGNIFLIEWAERIKKIIPKEFLWVKFEWLGKNKRKIIFK